MYLIDTIYIYQATSETTSNNLSPGSIDEAGGWERRSGQNCRTCCSKLNQSCSCRGWMIMGGWAGRGT